MRRFHRFVPILTLVTFLFSGGLGSGTNLVLCERADGTVRIETPFNRCCDKEPSSCLDEEPSDAQTVASVQAIAPFGCGVCIDTPIFTAAEHQSTVRPATATEVVLRPDFSVLDATTPTISPDAALMRFAHAPAPIPSGAAHLSVATVVLRC